MCKLKFQCGKWQITDYILVVVRNYRLQCGYSVHIQVSMWLVTNYRLFMRLVTNHRLVWLWWRFAECIVAAVCKVQNLNVASDKLQTLHAAVVTNYRLHRYGVWQITDCKATCDRLWIIMWLVTHQACDKLQTVKRLWWQVIDYYVAGDKSRFLMWLYWQMIVSDDEVWLLVGLWRHIVRRASQVASRLRWRFRLDRVCGGRGWRHL